MIVSQGCTEVDHSAHNPKIKGSNPDTGTGGEKMVKNYKFSDLAGRFYTSESFCNLLKAKMKNALGLLFSILKKNFLSSTSRPTAGFDYKTFLHL